MNREGVKKILEQQLQLLSERSKGTASICELCSLTNEMSTIANLLLLVYGQ